MKKPDTTTDMILKHLKSTTENLPIYVPCQLSGSGETKTVSIGEVFMYKKELDTYAAESELVYDGQFLIALYDGYYNTVSRFSPRLYMVRDKTTIYYGRPMIDESNKDTVLTRTTPYIAGEIYVYKYTRYFYDGNENLWHLYDTSKILNTKNITTPEDIIKVFDELQERASELGYPIKLFSSDRPIHPFHGCVDVPLTLKYDESCTNAILAAINVKETVENLMSRYGGENNG